MKKPKVCNFCQGSKHEGQSHLMNAVRHGHSECFKIALTYSEPLQKNDIGLSALMLAAIHNRADMLIQLLPVSDLDAKTPPKTGPGMRDGGLDAEALAKPDCKALIISYREAKELEAIIGAGGKSKSKSL